MTADSSVQECLFVTSLNRSHFRMTCSLLLVILAFHWRSHSICLQLWILEHSQRFYHNSFLCCHGNGLLLTYGGFGNFIPDINHAFHLTRCPSFYLLSQLWYGHYQNLYMKQRTYRHTCKSRGIHRVYLFPFLIRVTSTCLPHMSPSSSNGTL
jgi:hypothetical protein